MNWVLLVDIKVLLINTAINQIVESLLHTTRPESAEEKQGVDPFGEEEDLLPTAQRLNRFTSDQFRSQYRKQPRKSVARSFQQFSIDEKRKNSEIMEQRTTSTVVETFLLDKRLHQSAYGVFCRAVRHQIG